MRHHLALDSRGYLSCGQHFARELHHSALDSWSVEFCGPAPWSLFQGHLPLSTLVFVQHLLQILPERRGLWVLRPCRVGHGQGGTQVSLWMRNYARKMLLRTFTHGGKRAVGHH